MVDHQTVETSETGDGRVDQLALGAAPIKVGLDGERSIGPTFGDERIGGIFGFLVVERDAGTCLPEQANTGRADSARASSYESDFGCEIEGKHFRLMIFDF